MVESKNKTTAARARIAHKLARYIRATPINLQGTTGHNQPSTSHLSITFSIQLSEEPPNVDSETKLTPGIPLMMRGLSTREPPKSQRQSREESPSLPAALSF